MRRSKMPTRTRQYSSISLYARLIACARPYWTHTVGYLLLSLLATPLALLAPLPLKLAIDNVIDGRPLPRVLRIMLPDRWQASTGSVLLFVTCLVIVFALITLLHQLLTAMLKTYIGEKLLISFRSRLFRH